MTASKSNGFLAPSTSCWPSLIMYVVPLRQYHSDRSLYQAETWDSKPIAVVSSYSPHSLLQADEENNSLFNARELGHLPRSGQRIALSIPDPHDPQPNLPANNKSSYLFGTQPTYVTKRGEMDEEVYGIWVDKGKGIVVSLFPVFCTSWVVGLMCRMCTIGCIILSTLGNRHHLVGSDIVCCPLSFCLSLSS